MRGGLWVVMRRKGQYVMRTAIFRITLLAVFLGSALACAQETSIMKARISVKGNQVYRGAHPFVIRAIETKELATPGAGLAEIAPVLNKVSSVGGNAVCFDLTGFNADFSTLSPESASTLSFLVEQYTWRRMLAICRVLAGDLAKADDAKRLAAVRTTAKAMSKEVRLIYWIGGSESEKLVAEFKKLAPGAVVLAQKGGDIGTSSDIQAVSADRPTILIGQTPPQDQCATIPFLLPDAEDSYAKMDAAMADPCESRPWTPNNALLSEQERAEGFVSLFDGKTLDGWWVAGPNKNGFRVNDGAIEWVATGGEMLLTRERYDNFVLRLDWRINKGGNSGVFIRAPRSNRASKIGMEIQIMGDAGNTPVKDTTGAVYDVVPPRVNAGNPAMEWNQYEITVNGPNLKIVLNGQVVQDLNLDDNEELRPRLRRGFIGLQDHSCQVAFKNIRVKKL